MILACAFLAGAWASIVPAAAVDASGTATIRCSSFSGSPQTSPAWTRLAPYSISGDQISLSTPGSENNQWHGAVDQSGHILLTGDGAGGGGAWVMHFTGRWKGTGKTLLEGGYHNVRGMQGHRTCTISL